LNFGQGPTYLV